MPITEPFSGSLTVGSTEVSLVSGGATLSESTAAGVYQAFIDLSALAVGDTYVVRVKEKVGAGAQRKVFSQPVYGPVADSIYVTASYILLSGWDVTVQKTSGSDRTIAWSIRKLA